MFISAESYSICLCNPVLVVKIISCLPSIHSFFMNFKDMKRNIPLPWTSCALCFPLPTPYLIFKMSKTGVQGVTYFAWLWRSLFFNTMEQSNCSYIISQQVSLSYYFLYFFPTGESVIPLTAAVFTFHVQLFLWETSVIWPRWRLHRFKS